MKKLLVVIALVCLMSVAGNGQAAQWKLDPVHSTIRFDIQHIFSVVSGQFPEFTADIDFDPKKLNTAKFDFSVNVKSINTLNTKRDNHLRAKDFFNANKFPIMTFKSSKVTHIEAEQYALEGMMTIKDVQQPMTIRFSFYGPDDHPFEKKSYIAGFDTTFEINRLAFHVGDGTFHKLGVVGDMVNIRISIEALTNK